MFHDKKKNICFWCGRETGEMVLLHQAPVVHSEGNNSGIFSYDPCPVCSQEMAQGVTFFEAEKLPVYEGHTAIMPNVYPTGNWMVATQESAEKYFKEKTKKHIFLYSHEFEWILKQVEGIDYDEVN